MSVDIWVFSTTFYAHTHTFSRHVRRKHYIHMHYRERERETPPNHIPQAPQGEVVSRVPWGGWAGPPLHHFPHLLYAHTHTCSVLYISNYGTNVCSNFEFKHSSKMQIRGVRICMHNYYTKTLLCTNASIYIIIPVLVRTTTYASCIIHKIMSTLLWTDRYGLDLWVTDCLSKHYEYH